MQNDTQPLKIGAMFLVVLALSLSSCRHDTPPSIEICIGDGFGGADCIEKDGSRLYRSPSALKNYWLTNEADEAAYASWCYKTSSTSIEPVMREISTQARR